jgi:hypothetical protein
VNSVNSVPSCPGGGARVGLEGLVLGHHRPGDAGEFVGHGDSQHGGVKAVAVGVYPGLDAVTRGLVAFRGGDRRAGALDEEPAQRALAVLGDAAEARARLISRARSANSLRSSRAQALSWALAVLRERMKSRGRPLVASKRLNASNGLDEITPPKSHNTARTGLVFSVMVLAV